jgi:hypothetical protein
MFPEVADIFRECGPSFRDTHRLPRNQLRAMHAVEICRTQKLGGHIDQCEGCNHIRISYNSCRNRHCPKCQFLKKEKWCEARKRELLPIPYFHVVFTLPEECNPLALRNQKVVYSILFKAASQTLLECAQRRLGVEIGFSVILHTWGQNLMDHPHVHCIVTGGGLSPHGWKSAKRRFLLPVKVLSRLFRGKFLSFLKRAYERDELVFPGAIAVMKDQFTTFLTGLYAKQWVVYCKPPFHGPETVLEYLGRYTHRVAIANHRILSFGNGRVAFSWKDYADGNKKKTMILDVSEFIRRFLLHILPDGFVKIRYYGLLGNRNKSENLARCREILGVLPQIIEKESWEQCLLRLTGIDIMECPLCHGRMRRREMLLPKRGPP